MKTSDRFNRQSISYIILCAFFVIFTSPQFWTFVQAQVIIQGVQQLAGGNFTSAVTFSVNPTLFTAGTAGAPSIALSGTPTTGFYFPSTTNIYTTTGLGVA